MNKNKLKVIYFMLICLFTVLTSLYLSYIYGRNKIETLSSVIREIKVNELSSYFLENPDIVLYLDYESNFDDELSNYILENDLESKVVFINMNLVHGNVFDELIEYTPLKCSNIIVIKDRKVINGLYDNCRNISVNDFINFLEVLE